MIKRNKWILIISSAVILLPMLVGVFGGDVLPDSVAIHWGIDGQPDGFGDPAQMFFIFPPVLLAVHWICVAVSAVMNKRTPQNKKLERTVLWIIPIISIAISAFMISVAMGNTTDVHRIICLLLGVLFVIIGNYLPKTTRNITMGIKIKWTLMSDENWNATHRFSGKVYVIVGILCLLGMVLPEAVFPAVLITVLLVGILLPVIYSYVFYKKQLARGKIDREESRRAWDEVVKKNKIPVVITTVAVTVILAAVAVLMFVGNIETTLGDEGIYVKASFCDDLELKYEDIDAVEYREEGVPGQRVIGFGSARLLLGKFQNEEFGTYTRYTYTTDAPCVVLTVDDNIIVLSDRDANTVRDIYERISDQIGQQENNNE